MRLDYHPTQELQSDKLHHKIRLFMTDKVREQAPAIWEEIEKAKKILLHCHYNPDQDSVWSALAMKLALEAKGKTITLISGDSEITKSLKVLPGADQIVNADYFSISPEKFDLFIVLDSASLEQISRKGKIVFPEGMSTVVIDHHASNTSFGKINLAETTYPATAQILFDLFKIWGITVTPEIAANLFTGMYTDTGGFKYPMTNHETFLAAAELVKIYPDFSKIIFAIENLNEPENIYYLGLAFSSVGLYFGGKVAVTMVPFEKLQEKGIAKKNTSKMEVSNTLKSVDGWDIGIAFVEVEKNYVDLSMRTRNEHKYDLSRLAVALGGGGHPAAAGASIRKSFDEAKKMLLEALKSTYPELGNP